MYRSRLVIIFVLILAILVAYTPQVREQTRETWKSVQPGVVQIMDILYVAVRDIIASSGREDQMDIEPDAPAGDFDRIVTMATGVLL